MSLTIEAPPVPLLTDGAGDPAVLAWAAGDGRVTLRLADARSVRRLA